MFHNKVIMYNEAGYHFKCCNPAIVREPFHLGPLTRENSFDWSSLPYWSLNEKFGVELDGVGIRQFMDPTMPTKKITNSWVLKITKDLDSTQINDLKTVMNDLNNKFLYVTYGDTLIKIIREQILEKLDIPKGDPLYIERASNCKIIDEALGISTLAGQALFLNPANIPEAIDYIAYNHTRFLKDTTTNASFKDSIMPDGASIIIYDTEMIKDWIKQNYLFMPLISISEVVGYLLKTSSASHTDLAVDWAMKDYSPTQVKLIQDHIEIIKYFLKKHNQAHLINNLNGNLESISTAIKAYLAILNKDAKDLSEFQKELKSILHYDVPIIEILLLNNGLTEKSNPRKPVPNLIFIGGPIGYQKDTQVNQLGLDHLYAGYAFDNKPTTISITDKNNSTFMDMGYYLTLPDETRARRKAYEEVIMQLITLISSPSVSIEDKEKLAAQWNRITEQTEKHP